MKKRILRSVSLIFSVVLFLTACGLMPAADNADETKPEQTAVPEADIREDISDKAEETKASYFVSLAEDTDRMILEAREQYEAEDHTPLAEPVKYNVLWLGFTQVYYEDLDFRMTDFDREYLEAVALNYEKSVESISDHNIDISVDLHFIEDSTPLTKTEGDDWLFLAQETVQPFIELYVNNETDTVLTTVQTAGEENVERNRGRDGYGINYVMLGLETAGLSSSRGYSTFDLQKPVEGTYPLQDPEIPSLYATAVAVHEWMHQLESLGSILDIEYPNTHAYMGAESFPGYQKYNADENDYDFFEFYKLVLKGELPYTGDAGLKHVGMYPKMWPLIKRNVFNIGNFTIKAADKAVYLSGQTSDPTLTVSDKPCSWNIRYCGEGRFSLSPDELPDKLIDLSNAWDAEDNSIGLWVYTGYTDAQSWCITGNDDGSYSLKTPYESSRLITIRDGAYLCSEGAEGIQKWMIEALE
ncbi:MAG: hypothetical protein K6B44_13550 [Lachnospiraceae bacterium]|nr:hypothetical protein [Lachnospiraceae bacterium]